MNYKSFKKIIFILITFSFFPVIISMESFAYTCNITNPEDKGCCGTCSGWFDFCWPTAVLGDPPTKCNTPEGTCICNEVAYCNSAVIESCVDPLSLTPGEVHQCDDCCCTLAGGTPGDPDPWDPPDPNIWYGVMGIVWSDFNNNGSRDEGEDWKGLPQYDSDGRCAPTTHQQDYSITVNGENIARAWWCVGTPRIHTTRFEYYSHHDDFPGWIGLNAGMSRGNYYTATLGNLPSGSSCGTWSVYNDDGSFQGSGAGCDASFLFTTVNNYMRIDWKLGSDGCTSDADCNDNLFCTDDICNADGTCSNPPKSCDDGFDCTTDSCDENNDACVNPNVPVNGFLGSWGNCSNGNQASSCSGYSCGGSCSAECAAEGGTYNLSNHTCTRPCLRIDGNIWSDDDKNGITISDYWKKDLTSPSDCDTNKTFSSFIMTVSDELPLNQISDWWCHPSGYGVYFNTPVPYSIEPESTKTASLTSIPAGYDVLSWKYRYLKDGIITSQTGLGGVASNLLMPPYANWVNLHWELEQQTYNLTINVKKIKPEITDLPGSCGDNDIYDGPLSDASITVRDRDDNTVVCSGSSNSGGDLVCPVWILQGPLNIEATKTIGGATPETYELRCPNSTVYEYYPGSVNDGDNKSVGIGLKVNYKDGWVSAIDSDIFANIINVVVPEGPTDNSNTNQTPQGFAKTLINSSVNDEKHLGFIFSEVNDRSNPNVDTECPDSKGFETTDDQCTNLGGFSYNLISGGEHDSKWLESFTFKAPENSLDYTPKSTSFKSGEIYNISIGSGGGDILPTSYSITDGDSVAILYVDGNLEINNNVTTNSSGRLLLVVNGSVTISKDVGTDVGSFLLSQDPNIEAGIVASGGIHFNSIGGLIEEGNNDKPIMVSAPLISKESLTFGRDLYHDNNATMPAESAKSFNKYLYLLTSLEREKSIDNLYFTGLTTYDLDWEYIY